MAWSNVASIGGSLVGGWLANKNSKDANNSASQQGQLDPRIAGILFGQNGSGGLLDKYQGYLNQPQSDPSKAFGSVAGNYVGTQMGPDLGIVRNAAQNLIGGNAAPQAYNPMWNTATTVDAPAQNSLDLTGSYNNLLGGGDTSKLMASLQAGNDLTSAQFQKNQTDITNNLTRNVLPSIRGGAIAAGQYGGSRQGIAEGNALSDYTNQLTSANTQLGAANSANTANALAGAYENGQSRALAATQGLGAQQYGVAQENAQLGQASQFANQQVGNSYNLANLQSQLTTNGQNNAASIAGQGILGGLANQLYGYSNANDNYDITRATQVNDLLKPYLSMVPTQNGVSTNTTNATLGGALGGLQFGSQLGSLFGGGKSSTGASMGTWTDLFGSGSTFGNYGGSY